MVYIILVLVLVVVLWPKKLKVKDNYSVIDFSALGGKINLTDPENRFINENNLYTIKGMTDLGIK